MTSMGYCALGYKGGLCSECETPKFGMVENYRCKDCGVGSNYAMKFISLGFAVMIVTLAIWKNLKLNTYLKHKKDNLSKEFEENALSAFLLRIISQHFSVILILKSLPYHFPEELENSLSFIFSSFSSNGSADIFSFDCLYKYFGFDLEGPLNLKLVMMNSFNLAYILILTLIMIHVIDREGDHDSSGRKPQKNFLANMKSIFLVVYLCLFSNIVEPNLDMFLCINLGDSSQNIESMVLLKDTSIPCSQSTYNNLKNFLSVPILILVGLITFIIIYEIFRAYRNHSLYSEKVLEHMGAFYYIYDSKYFFFEFVIIARKSFFILAKALFLWFMIYDLINSALIILFAFLLLNHAVHHYRNPYKSQFLLINEAEKFSFKINIFNTFMALLWFANESAEVESYLIIIFVAILNFIFLVYWFAKYQRYLRHKALTLLSLIKKYAKIFTRKSKESDTYDARVDSRPDNHEQNVLFTEPKAESEDKSNYREDKSHYRNLEKENRQLLKIVKMLETHILHLEKQAQDFTLAKEAFLKIPEAKSNTSKIKSHNEMVKIRQKNEDNSEFLEIKLKEEKKAHQPVDLCSINFLPVIELDLRKKVLAGFTHLNNFLDLGFLLRVNESGIEIKDVLVTSGNENLLLRLTEIKRKNKDIKFSVGAKNLCQKPIDIIPLSITIEYSSKTQSTKETINFAVPLDWRNFFFIEPVWGIENPPVPALSSPPEINSSQFRLKMNHSILSNITSKIFLKSYPVILTEFPISFGIFFPLFKGRNKYCDLTISKDDEGLELLDISSPAPIEDKVLLNILNFLRDRIA